jgi:mono/diheme cytochrome c family protein
MRLGILLAAALGAAVVFVDSAFAQRIELPQGPNRDLVYARCRVCHDLQYVVDSAGITGDNWKALIEDMGRYGLRIPGEERDKIVSYLVTYLGPDASKRKAQNVQTAEATVDGKAVYARQCTSCHQPGGMGLPKTFPPLADNPDLYLDRLFPVYVVLNGLEGPATIKGEHYQGAMPPFDHLSNAEIAAVVGYIRSAWGNARLRPSDFSEVSAVTVAEARSRPMKPKEVLAYRAGKR